MLSGKLSGKSDDKYSLRIFQMVSLDVRFESQAIIINNSRIELLSFCFIVRNELYVLLELFVRQKFEQLKNVL